MGVDRYIYKNGKLIADLGRSYHYTNAIDDDDISEFKMYLCSRMTWPSDPDGCRLAINEFNNEIDIFIDECIKLGKRDVCELMLESGMEIVDE